MKMDRRRAILALLSFAAAGRPLCARADSPPGGKRFRISTFPDPYQHTQEAFSAGMRDLGWVEGKDFIIVKSGLEYGASQSEQVAQHIITENPDVIVTLNTGYALALHRKTATIPIVMIWSGYPVEAGVATSLAHPGKNVTGNSTYAGYDIWGKLLQLLHETKARIRRVGVLWSYVPPLFLQEEIEPAYRELRRGAQTLGLTIQIVEVATPHDVPAALAKIDAGRVEGLMIPSGSGLWPARDRVIQFAAEKRLPTIGDTRWPPTDKQWPLLVYTPPSSGLARRAASFVDRILRGAQPRDLPIALPTTFALTINLKMAKTIGLTVPSALLHRADEMIE